MTGRTDYPVIVIGGGPTGITAATLLGQNGVRCLVLDRWPQVYPQPRAVHLDDEVFRILDRLGVAQEFSATSRPSQGLRLLTAGHRVLAEFPRDGVAPKTGYPRANMFDQPVLEEILRANLKTAPSVEFLGDVEVVALDTSTGHRAVVRFRSRSDDHDVREVSARFVLGCDGANSLVRQAIGSTYTDLHFEQRWLVVDVSTDVDLHQWEGVHQVCSSRRAGTFMRIGETRYRWEFALHDDETPADFPDIESLMPLLSPWTEPTSPRDLSLVRVAEYTFRAMVADRWRRGPVFLLGDAAHLTPPFIGQGMGAGIRDAHNLAWKLAGVLDGVLPEQVLDSYEAERKPHAESVIRLARLVGVVMTGGGRAGDAARRLVAPSLPLLPGVRSRVADSETAPLGRNRWVRRSATDRLAGTLCPSARVAGARVDTLTRTGMTLVTVEPASQELRTRLAVIGGSVLEVGRDHDLGRWLRAHRRRAALVRPDWTVLASATRSDRLGDVLSALLDA